VGSKSTSRLDSLPESLDLGGPRLSQWLETLHLMGLLHLIRQVGAAMGKVGVLILPCVARWLTRSFCRLTRETLVLIGQGDQEGILEAHLALECLRRPLDLWHICFIMYGSLPWSNTNVPLTSPWTRIFLGKVAPKGSSKSTYLKSLKQWSVSVSRWLEAMHLSGLAAFNTFGKQAQSDLYYTW
jgi:hypothetical protein